MQLVLNTNGLTVKKRNGAFWIWAKEGRRMISPQRVTSIAVTADCLLSSAAIRLAAEHGIPIYFFDRTGKADARLWSANFGSIATIRREQVLFALKPEATAWMVDLFRLKTAHQADVLRMLARRKRHSGMAAELSKQLATLEQGAGQFQLFLGQPIRQCAPAMMGVEGSLARGYWDILSRALPPAYQFPSRSRRPAKDLFNAALNYLYGMLYNLVGSAALAAGLDPYLGFLHRDEYNRPAFVFDLIEPFRPWVDGLIVGACLDGLIRDTHITAEGEGVWLNTEGRKILIPLFNGWMQEKTTFQHKRLSRTQHIYRFAGEFAQRLLHNPSEDEDILDLL